MLRRLAGAIAANPFVYDLIQKAVGVDVVNARVARVLEMRPGGLLVDVGAGTGLEPRLRPAGSRYLAVDLDRAKLRRLRSKEPDAASLLGDGTRLPLQDGSAEAILVKAVIHHLDAAELEAFLAEVARVLQPGGRLVLSDPVWAPRRWPGRLLWAGDRGSHPRTPADLRLALQSRFEIRHWETYAILHRYVLAVAVPAAQGSIGAGGSPRAR